MRVQEKGNYTLSVYQKNKRMFKKTNYEYSPFKI